MKWVPGQDLVQDLEALLKLVLVEQHLGLGQQNISRSRIPFEAVVEAHRGQWGHLIDGHVESE